MEISSSSVLNTAPPAGTTGVQALFRAGCPADVAGLVAPVVVNPVEGQVNGPRSEQLLDVLDEQPDIVPACANGDAPSAVILELMVLDVVAPGHHARPGAVQRVTRQPVFSRRLSQGSQGDFPVQAPARLRWLLPAKEVGQPRLVDSAAVTTQVRPANTEEFLTVQCPELIDDDSSAESVSRLDSQLSSRTPHQIGQRSGTPSPRVAHDAQRPGNDRASAARCRTTAFTIHV